MKSKKTLKTPANDVRTRAIHKNLSNLVERTRRELQMKADKKWGKGKVKVSSIYASKILAGRLK